MKHIFILSAILFSINSFGVLKGVPFIPEIDQRFNALEVGSSTVAARQTAKVVYDTAINGSSATAHGLGVYLPAGAIIVRSWLHINTAFANGTGTVAISCEDANNIKTATDFTAVSADALVEGASTGAISAAVKSIAAQCEVTATVATNAQTVGKMTVWIDYVIDP